MGFLHLVCIAMDSQYKRFVAGKFLKNTCIWLQHLDTISSKSNAYLDSWNWHSRFRSHKEKSPQHSGLKNKDRTPETAAIVIATGNQTDRALQSALEHNVLLLRHPTNLCLQRLNTTGWNGSKKGLESLALWKMDNEVICVQEKSITFHITQSTSGCAARYSLSCRRSGNYVTLW